MAQDLKKVQHNKQETHRILWQIKGSENSLNPESYSLDTRAFFWDTALNPFSQTKPQLSWANIATTKQLNRKQHLLPSLMYFAEPTLRTTEGRAQELGQAENPSFVNRESLEMGLSSTVSFEAVQIIVQISFRLLGTSNVNESRHTQKMGKSSVQLSSDLQGFKIWTEAVQRAGTRVNRKSLM